MDIFKRKISSHDEYIHYLIEVQQARVQWENSIKYFEAVCEEDLVEYAIYEMEAAKRRYICMLNRLRDMYFELKKNRDTYQLEELPQEQPAISLESQEKTDKILNAAQNKS